MHARTQSTVATDTGALAPMLGALHEAVPGASAGIVFVSGALARDVGVAANAVRAKWPSIPSVIVPAAGVITEKGEIERVGAASAVLWKGGRAEATVVKGTPLAAGMARAANKKPATALLFCRPDWLDPDALDAALADTAPLCVLGAGTLGPPAVGVTTTGTLLEAPAIALLVQGLAAPLVEASPACELLGEFAPIDEAEGGCVLRIGGRPALEALSACAARLRDRGTQPFVFAAVAGEPEREPGVDRDSPAYFVRPIRGIDPPRRGVYIGSEARVGTRITFGLRDANASRTNLQSASHRLHERAGGADPRFALFIDCAGRGETLYGTADVDVRVLRQRFGELPFAGMHSAFEIAPHGPNRSRVHFYTGVVALFRSPS